MLPGLLSVLIFFPALGALALLLLRGDDHVWIRRLAMTISVIEFVFSLVLMMKVPLDAKGYSLEEFHGWIHVPPINYHVGVDGLSLFLVILTTFLTPISVLASWSSIHHRVKEFFVMLLMLEVGVVGVFLSLDLFLFFLFWEVMRRGEIRHLHHGRLHPDARGHHLAVQRHRYVRSAAHPADARRGNACA